MPRKYSGPLQKGKRSAYVKGTRVNQNRRRRYVKKVGLNKVEKKQVKAIVKAKKETLFCDKWYRYDDAADYGDFLQKPIVGGPTLLPIYNGSAQAATGVILQAGHYLNDTSTIVNQQYSNMVYPLGGLGMERGVDNDDITGNFAYMNSRQIHLQINAVPFPDDATDKLNKYYRPLQFRVLHITMKASHLNLPNMLNALFIDQMGNRIGLDESGSVKDLMYDWKINTDQFTVRKDFKIKLQQTPVNPATLQVSGGPPTAGQVFDQGPRHPSQYNCSFWLDRPKKKLRFATTDNGTNNNYEPLNANLQDYVLVFCTRYETCGNPGALNNVGVQTADQWQVRVSGTTKYREA